MEVGCESERKIRIKRKSSDEDDPAQKRSQLFQSKVKTNKTNHNSQFHDTRYGTESESDREINELIFVKKS